MSLFLKKCERVSHPSKLARAGNGAHPRVRVMSWTANDRAKRTWSVERACTTEHPIRKRRDVLCTHWTERTHAHIRDRALQMSYERWRRGGPQPALSRAGAGAGHYAGGPGASTRRGRTSRRGGAKAGVVSGGGRRRAWRARRVREMWRRWGRQRRKRPEGLPQAQHRPAARRALSRASDQACIRSRHRLHTTRPGLSRTPPHEAHLPAARSLA